MKKPVCAIVGMGPGVSFGVAKKFGKLGYTIAMIARKPAKLDDLRAELRKLEIDAHGFAADASSVSEVSNAFDQIHKSLGPVDVLLYNAYGMHPGNPTELNPNYLVDDFKASVMGAVVSVQKVVSEMIRNKRGTILLTGGGLSLFPQPAAFSLGLGKAGIRNLAMNLHAELKPQGIRVGTVTICGTVQEGTHFSPEKIADSFFSFHDPKSDQNTFEIVYK